MLLGLSTLGSIGISAAVSAAMAGGASIAAVKIHDNIKHCTPEKAEERRLKKEAKEAKKALKKAAHTGKKEVLEAEKEKIENEVKEAEADPVNVDQATQQVEPQPTMA